MVKQVLQSIKPGYVKKIILLLCFSIFLSSCTTFFFTAEPISQTKSNSALHTGRSTPRNGDSIPPLKPGWESRIVSDGFIVPDDVQQLIVDSGIDLTESGQLTIHGKSFTHDCTGTVLAAYWGAGLDPAKYFHQYSGNGVKRLNDMGAKYDLNYLSALPNPGDIIIWDDTYDKDENGEWGDPYTHAGVVISVSEDGQIAYLHYNYVKGVVIEYMNLNQPDTFKNADGEQINSAMRMRSDRHIRPDSWLASHLVRGFIPMYMYPGILDK